MGRFESQCFDSSVSNETLWCNYIADNLCEVMYSAWYKALANSEPLIHNGRHTDKHLLYLIIHCSNWTYAHYNGFSVETCFQRYLENSILLDISNRRCPRSSVGAGGCGLQLFSQALAQGFRPESAYPSDAWKWRPLFHASPLPRAANRRRCPHIQRWSGYWQSKIPWKALVCLCASWAKEGENCRLSGEIPGQGHLASCAANGLLCNCKVWAVHVEAWPTIRLQQSFSLCRQVSRRLLQSLDWLVRYILKIWYHLSGLENPWRTKLTKSWRDT